MTETARLYAVGAQQEADEEPTLLLPHELTYVTETATGLTFAPDTPIAVWSGIITRLLAQHKRIEWAIADAINFGDRQYGEVYSQWVEESGLAKKTLANIAWVGRKVESSRRREDVDFSYHAEVAALPPVEQDRLLETAVDQGMSRYDLREAARTRKKELAGGSVDEAGAPIETAPLAWVPEVSDLVEDVRRSLEANAPLGRHRNAWIAGALWWMVYRGDESAFLPGRWGA